MVSLKVKLFFEAALGKRINPSPKSRTSHCFLMQLF
jgi:hypothetical protein